MGGGIANSLENFGGRGISLKNGWYIFDPLTQRIKTPFYGKPSKNQLAKAPLFVVVIIS